MNFRANVSCIIARRGLESITLRDGWEEYLGNIEANCEVLDGYIVSRQLAALAVETWRQLCIIKENGYL